MTDALKLCPFCGSDHVRINGGSNSSYVECLECGVEGPFSDFTEAQAASAWNRRHVAVTEEMVENALYSQAPADEYDGLGGDLLAMMIDFMGMGTPEMLPKARKIMRAALTAALIGEAND